jgi:PAS domain S-box-containing protein/putative nucleotidyltransferase with HDIG domain
VERLLRRENVVPVVEMVVALAATAVALILGERFQVASILRDVSQRAKVGLDIANLGPGLFVMVSGFGFMSVRRWKEAVDERRVLSETRDVLAGSEERYRSLVEMSPAPIVVSDAATRIIFVNDAAVHLLRAPSAEAVLGQPISDYVHSANMAHAMELYVRVLAGETIATDELRLRRADGTDVVVQLLSVFGSIDGSPCVQNVLQDVTHLTKVADTLQRACVDTVEAMARLADARDPYTSGHQARVAELAEAMARHMGLPPTTLRAIHVAAIVHDIGKINVPLEILSKPGKLTEAEFDLIKMHAELGYEILAPIEFPWPIADIVRQHHERLDGSGYPLGITGDEMLPESRILAVADVVEAIASDRPYRPARGLDAAFDVIRQGRGTLYDPASVDACFAVAASVITSESVLVA